MGPFAGLASTRLRLHDLPEAEKSLSLRDTKLGRVIAAQRQRWPTEASEDPIWGLLRIVMAQQVSTRAAWLLAERVKAAYPLLPSATRGPLPDSARLRKMGLSTRRAECCATILARSEEILDEIRRGRTWKEALTGIKGIGPWTLSVFQIMVLREPDELPLGDVGLERAITNIYGASARADLLGDTWRPFRSVACWYLWRTLGNEQLG